MKSNTVLLIFGAVIVVAAILYLITFLMRRRNVDRLDKLEERKIALFDLPVIEEVDEIKKMHLVGQSQNTFREWNQRWTEISTSSFADLESRIFEAESLNDSLRFLKVKKAIENAYETMDEMETEVEEIRVGLRELRESEEKNSHAVQEALDSYEEISETVKSEGHTFGPSLKEIQKQVKNIEADFTQFVALNTSGDPMEARAVLEEAERRTYEIKDKATQIPPLFEEVDKTFPEQLKEIETGFKQLKKDNYQFPDNFLEENIKKAKKELVTIASDLEKCEVDLVEVSNRELASLIEQLYDKMEKEIQAKAYVKTNQKPIADYINHAQRNNRHLMIELDHTSQSYVLNHNELGKSRGFQAQIDEIQKRNLEIDEKMKANEAIFSEVEEFYKNTFQYLNDIENQQLEIDTSVQNLRVDEKSGQVKMDDFEFRLRNMKRYIEKQRLPGIPADYLEFFFVATDRVEELGKELGKIRIDIEQINRLVGLCEDDLALLDQKTDELIDHATLTEQMLQYANRFRHTHPVVKDSIERSLELFNREYRYQDALDEISAALERTEPGSSKRLTDFYFNNKETV